MAIYIKRAFNSPTNDCVKETTQPEELIKGTDCERSEVGNSNTPIAIPEGYGDGYVHFLGEGSNPTSTTPLDSTRCAPGQEFRGYHRFTLTEFLTGKSVTGECVTPYSRAVLGQGGFQGVLVAREADLISATGKPVQLLRRQYTGARCPCYSLNRGRSKKRCAICYGTAFVPGYVPYINDSDPLGRIIVRFDPHEENLAIKENGMMQEVEITGWTLPFPEIRQRDVLIVYNITDGTEEYRYEIMRVTSNETFMGQTGAQKLRFKRIDPTDPVYSFDPFAIPDLADISVDVSTDDPIISDRIYDELGTADDGKYADISTEIPFGDGAFSGMFTQGYKAGYELNFKRCLNFQQPQFIPDFTGATDPNTMNEGYGPIFTTSSGQIIYFSTPQMIQSNPGAPPLEVVVAENKRHFLEGFLVGAKHGWQDGENELRARGQLT